MKPLSAGALTGLLFASAVVQVSSTPATVDAVATYDGGNCGTSSTLGYIATASPFTSLCSAGATTCSGGTGMVCTDDAGYKADIATVLGTTPHVLVSTYTTAVCTSALTNVKAYLADAKCHMITLSSKYYKTVISAGGNTATISFYSNADCSTPYSVSNVATDPIVVTQAQVATGCTTSVTPAIKVDFSLIWPAPKKVLTAFDGGDCTKTLGSISIAASGNTCSDDSDACDSTTGTGAICTTDYQYDSAIATKFGSTPYVSIATFTAASCAWSAISTLSAYVADGKCHMIAANKYYKVTVTPFGGGSTIAKISGFSDAACGSASADSSVLGSADISVTKSQLTSTSGCATANSASTLYKISANWPKALGVAGIGTYATPASGACTGTPSKLTLTALTGNADCTSLTATCTTANVLADCSSNTDYKNYLSTAFGAAPYLIKESYSGTNCGALTSVNAYVADGTCYKEGSNSAKLVVTSTGIAFRTWASDVDCGVTVTTTVPTDTPVSTTSLVSNACTTNTKYYMKGSSWTFASNAVYDDSKCALTPNKLTLGWAPTCAAPTGDAACLTTTSTAATPLTVYNAPGCTKTASSSYFSAIDKAFGMTTYVVQESYTPSCGAVTGVVAYVADATCHLSADATSSYKVTYDATSTTAQVKIETFTTTDCTTTAATTTSVAPAAITGKTCVTDTKTYVGGLAAKLTAVTTFSDKDCKVPVQTVFSSTATTCAAVTACTSAGGGLYTKTACTTATVDYAAILATVFGTTRRLVTDIYEAKDGKCNTRQGTVAYVGDATCHTTLDGTFFKVTLGSSNTATDATFSTFSDKDCTKDEKKLTIAAANLATATTAPCDTTNFIKFSIGGTEPPTDAPTTAAPTPATTTAVSTGSGKSAAVSSFSVSIFGLLASILGGLAVLLN
ncbi:hypothetical protein V7S43_010837 [Phytophthora oleae]|uniref:Uncharacterized protein n=1 Tax=Phytophthora oleae TaxID=2107226 RepID=A0ABD3FAL8_9STRA